MLFLEKCGNSREKASIMIMESNYMIWTSLACDINVQLLLYPEKQQMSSIWKITSKLTDTHVCHSFPFATESISQRRSTLSCSNQ